METLNTCITNRHGLKVAVLVEKPEQPSGLIFIMHGFTSSHNRPSTARLARTSVRNNLITVRFDCTHACGASNGLPENGTITSFVEDLNDVVTWAKMQEWFQTPFILAGTSLGGIAILEYTHHHPNDILAIAPVCTVISGQLSIENMERRNPGSAKLWQETGFQERSCNCSPGGLVQIPWAHVVDRMRYNALQYAPDMTMPLFMCVGTKDTSCPPEQQQFLFDVWGGQIKELHFLEDAPHALQEEKDLLALEKHFEGWLKGLNQGDSDSDNVIHLSEMSL